MHVEESTTTKLVISEIENLDPVTVFLEDFGPSQGRITIGCWGESWTSYWGAMGGRTISRFFAECDEHYLAGNLASGLSDTRFDPAVLAQDSKLLVIERRKNIRRGLEFGPLEKELARQLFDEADDLRYHDSPMSLPDDTMSAIYGNEWHRYIDFGNAPNAKYQRLLLVISTVRKALRNRLETKQ